MSSKELFLSCPNDIKVCLDVGEEDTLSNIRQQILQDFDDYLLNDEDRGLTIKDFAFDVGGVRILRKQEVKKLAWNLLDKEIKIQPVRWIKKRSIMVDETEEIGPQPVKKIKVDCQNSDNPINHFVTPQIKCSVKSKNVEQLMDPLKQSFLKNDVIESEQNADNSSEIMNDGKNEVLNYKSQPEPKNLENYLITVKDYDIPVSKSENGPIYSGEHRDTGYGDEDPLKQDLKTSDETSEENQSFSFLQDQEEIQKGGEGVGEINPFQKDQESEYITVSLQKDLESDDDTVDLCSDETIGKADEASTLNNDDVMSYYSSKPDEDSNAVDTSRSVLRSIKSMLSVNPFFCSFVRCTEWMNEINAALLQATPNTTVGVLGNTGVGKSSLLNALLDEASVLPTSGSRGCTAAVVELRYNYELVKSKGNSEEVSVYRGDVEFITLQEWFEELIILVDECSTEEGKVYACQPLPQNHAEAAAAWSKIDQVYGQGTMLSYSGKKKNYVFQALTGNLRVNKYLTPKAGSSNRCNVISIKEGSVIPGSADANELLSSFADMRIRMRRIKKKWASDFRNNINNYVYRKGNGNEPQTWPLIQKVVLYGPWAVLSTQCCLVDLPGVRDANAARARVSEQYLKNCNQIWVVAPIKRAVDDGTAKELLGEQFKRRLLMDGQYGNVSFICTQTDDCEATEIMRDHADVAQQVPGRWEEMEELCDKICSLDNEILKSTQEHDEVKAEHNDADHQFKKSEKDLKIMEKKTDCSSEHLSELKFKLESEKQLKEDCYKKLQDWEKKNLPILDSLMVECEVEQRKLKAICAIVRNEYSTKCLQADFRSGLKDLYRKDDENENNSEHSEMALPPDFNMDVYTISSNDYLKIQGIKPKRDGSPNTFGKVEDTQIPRLRTFVHEISERLRTSFTKKFVNHASDILDRIKLFSMNASKVPSGQKSLQCIQMFNKEIVEIGNKVDSLNNDFTNSISMKVKLHLEPSLTNGAKKAVIAALPVVESWGSKSRRSNKFRDLNHNGLYWSTYNATVRRSGVFTSGCAGNIDMNQELCDPMEKEYSLNWQRILDSALKLQISDVEKKVEKICKSVNNTLVNSFEQKGMNKVMLSGMSNTANRSCLTAVKNAFDDMRQLATETQRNLSRTLLEFVKDNMSSSYEACLDCPRGTGAYDRMKRAMMTTTKKNVNIMFKASKETMLKGVDNLVKQLVQLISKAKEAICKHLEDVYSMCWDDQSLNKVVDPVTQEKIRVCRDNLIPVLNKLSISIKKAQETAGVEREDLELDLLAIEPIETAITRKMNDAEEKGEVIDLCDSEEEIEDIIDRLPPAKPIIVRIKQDPGSRIIQNPYISTL